MAIGSADVDPTPRQITFDLQPANDAPTFVAQGDQDATDESGSVVVLGWATAISAGPSDEMGQAVQFVVQGNTNPDLFAVQPTIDAAGNLSFEPELNAEGLAEISIVLDPVRTRATFTRLRSVCPRGDLGTMRSMHLM